MAAVQDRPKCIKYLMDVMSEKEIEIRQKVRCIIFEVSFHPQFIDKLIPYLVLTQNLKGWGGGFAGHTALHLATSGKCSVETLKSLMAGMTQRQIGLGTNVRLCFFSIHVSSLIAR